MCKVLCQMQCGVAKDCGVICPTGRAIGPVATVTMRQIALAYEHREVGVLQTDHLWIAQYY